MPSLLIDIGANIARLQQDVAHAQKSIQGFARSAESAFKTIGSVAITAGMSLGIKNLAEMGAKALQVESSFKIMAESAGTSSENLIDSMSKATRATIEDSDLMQKAIKLMTLEYKPEQIERFSKVVITASQIAGTSALEAYEGLADAIANRMPKALVRMGAVTREQMKIVNAAIEGGADSVALYELAMANLEMKQKMLQGTQDSATISMQQFQAATKGAEETIGKGLFEVLKGAYSAFALLDAGVIAAASGIWKLIEGYRNLRAALSWGDVAKEHQAAADYAKNAAAEWMGVAKQMTGQVLDSYSEQTDASKKATQQQIADAKNKVDAQMAGLKIIADKEGRKELSDAAVKDFKEMTKILTEFEKESAKVGKSVSDQELIDLNIRYEYFKRFVTDEAKLEQWLADEKKSIMIRANNETIALWEELYKQTQNDKYAQAAIDAMKEILYAEEKKWSTILNSDDDAHTLRLKREQEYVDKVKGMITQVSTAEQQAVTAAVKSQYNYIAPSFSPGVSSDFSPGVGADFSPGFGYGAGAAGEKSVDLTKVNQVFTTQINYYNEQTNDYATKAADLAKSIADENKRVAEEYQREYDARKKTFETARGQFTDFMQERERQGWGAVQYQQQFSKLAQDFGSSQYFETSIDLLGQMIDVIKELDSIAQDQLEQQKQQTKSLQENSVSISDWLIELSQGSMAPVQSSAMWATRFEELKSRAMADQAKVGEFLAYAQKYLAFEKSYGTKGSYTAAYQSTVSAVSGLGDYMDLAAQLSNLGLGDSLSDIKGVIDAFAALGVGSVALKDAADAAAAAITSAATNTGTLSSAADTVSIATAGAATNTGSFATAAGAAAWQAASAAANTDIFTSSANAASLATMSAGLKTDGFTLATNSAASAAYDAAVKTGDYAAATNILKAAADLVAGSTLTAAAGTGALGSAVDTLKSVAGTAAGAEGMGKIITSLETTLPASAGIAGLEASGLSDALQDTKTPFENIKNAMTKTVSNLDVVGQFWADLAEQLGFTMNPANVGTALSSIQSSAYATIPWTVSEGYWYSPTGGKKPGGPGTDWSYFGYSYINAGSYPERPPGMAKGGLTSGLTFAGESGSEWVVPTYEPERSSFLRDVGADPEAIGAAIAKRISGMGGGGDIHVSVQIDGREIGSVVAKQMKTNRDLRESMRAN